MGEIKSSIEKLYRFKKEVTSILTQLRQAQLDNLVNLICIDPIRLRQAQSDNLVELRIITSGLHRQTQPDNFVKTGQ